jgi:hypothetical protein
MARRGGPTSSRRGTPGPLVWHPSVDAVTYWGITDEGALLGAPIGLARADETPKPSFEALGPLIEGEW